MPERPERAAPPAAGDLSWTSCPTTWAWGRTIRGGSTWDRASPCAAFFDIDSERTSAVGMTDLPWPYCLPIWRSAHRATSPDGRLTAAIDPAYEVSMGNPTCGTLRLSTGLELERCNPSFLWSDDSRHLAVPQFFNRAGLLRRQRLLVIDVPGGIVLAAPDRARYFQPESFSDGRLAVTRDPFKSARRVVWSIPADLGRFAQVPTR